MRPRSQAGGRIGGADEGLAIGRVAATLYPGAATRVVLTLDGGELAAISPAGAPAPAPGDEIGLSWAAEALHVMEDDR